VNRRLILVTVAVAGLLALASAPALATHTHVMQVGNGECVIIAGNGHEDDVVLPLDVWSNPNVDVGSTDTTRMHPLHVLVHKGVPGDHNALEVAGTGAATTMCSAGYVGS
jgi:hypothetical protein